jgi:hypothetical protein
MASYTSPLMAVVGGHTLPTGQYLPNATAFDIVFGVGLVLTAVVLVLSAMSKNYTFRSMAKPPAKAPE